MWGVYRHIKMVDGEEAHEELLSTHPTQQEAEAEAAKLTQANPNGPYTYLVKQI